jgi:hypothetical protein
MQEWLATQAANGFQAFAGSEMTASIHVSEALINELVAQALQTGMSSASASERPDIVSRALLKLVTRAAVKVVDGVVIVNADVRV